MMMRLSSSIANYSAIPANNEATLVIGGTAVYFWICIDALEVAHDVQRPLVSR